MSHQKKQLNITKSANKHSDRGLTQEKSNTMQLKEDTEDILYQMEKEKKLEMSQKNHNNTEKKIIYARVSSQKQKGDLSRQIEFLRTKYPDYQVISDIGSGINFERKGFKNILEGVFKGTISEVVVTNRDRFTRFGFELFEWIFQQHNSQLLADQTDNKNAQEELSEDLLSIITVFTARYYGKRRYKILSENQNIST